MQIVIDIPEEKYNMIKNKMYCGIYDTEVYEAISNGTILLKGHGRLIDADALELDYDWYEYTTSTGQLVTIGYQAYSLSQIENANAVIEADKGESEDKE